MPISANYSLDALRKGLNPTSCVCWMVEENNRRLNELKENPDDNENIIRGLELTQQADKNCLNLFKKLFNLNTNIVNVSVFAGQVSCR